VQAQADLAVVVDGPATFVRNSPVEFTASATNAGPSAAPAAAVVVWANVPSASVETVAPEGWTCATQPSALYRADCTPDEGSLEADALFRMNVSTQGKLFPARITMTASVASAANDPEPSNDRSSRTAYRGRP